MGKTKGDGPSAPRRPALSPESRENQMISYAVDLAEKQLREGTASSQVITHFLKLATEKSRLEKEKLARETELLRAKTEELEASKASAVKYDEVLRALRKYNGQGDPEDYEY